jgi:hypothetical protein
LIPIYESDYYAKLAEIKSSFIDKAQAIMGDKYYEFVPFYLESKINFLDKRLIVKMDFDPDNEQFRLVSLQLGTLDYKTVNIKDVVPVTFPEYESAHLHGKLVQPAAWHDLEMLYLNKLESEFYVFDRDGSWKEEGVSHPMLAWEARFNEHNWIDFTEGGSVVVDGGHVSPHF